MFGVWLLAAAVVLAACGDDEVSAPGASAEGSARLTVVASVYPMQYFAERVGGDRVEVVALVPPGVDGHDFELTPRDLLTIADADLIAMNGLELEPWLERAIESLGDDLDGIVVEAADASTAIPFVDHEAGHGDGEDTARDDGHDHGDGHEDDDGHEDGGHGDGHGHDDQHAGHAHGELDPHVWQDPLLAVTQAERIAEALSSRDPAGAATYEANLALLRDDLLALHADFEEGLSSCRHREFVTSHAAYGYIALRYGLEQVTVYGLTPGSDPSPQRLAGIADRIREAGLAAVLVEPVLSGEAERAISDETGAEILPIHALDGVTAAELAEHGDYLGLMRDNLRSLRAALDCT